MLAEAVLGAASGVRATLRGRGRGALSRQLRHLWVGGFLDGEGGGEVRLRRCVCFRGAWDLLSCWRNNQATAGKPRLRQAEPKLCLAVVKDVPLLDEGSFPGLSGAHRNPQRQ